MYARNKRLILILCGALLGFLFFAAALFILPSPPLETQVWKGYHTILVDSETDLSLLESRMIDAGFEEVIHLENVEIEYFDFPGLSAVNLVDVSARFEPLDPRIDPYMRELHRYFSTGTTVQDYSIVYVREREDIIHSHFECIRVLRQYGIEWRLVDVKPLFSLLLISLFGVVLVFVVLADREGWGVLIGSSAPWILLVMFGGFFEFLTASLVMATYGLFLHSYRRVFKFYLNHGYIDGGSRNAVFALTLLLLALLASFLLLMRPSAGFISAMRLLFCLLSTGFLFFSYLLMTVIRQNRQEHRLFFSVPLASRKDRRWLYRLGMFAVLLFSPFIGSMEVLKAVPPVPAPVFLSASQSLSAEAVEQMHTLRSESSGFPADRLRLPDIADYLAHRAFQEGFLYGRSYRFPILDERVGISSYSSGSGETVVRQFQEVIVFSEAWFDRILAMENPVGIVGLWLRQGTPVGSALVVPDVFSFNRASLARHLIICLVFGLPMVFLNNRLTPQLLYGIKSLTLRRKQQTA